MGNSALLAAQGNACFYCRRGFKKSRPPTRDHVWPKVVGRTLKDNIVLACRDCNSKKGCRLPYANELKRIRAIYKKIGRTFAEIGDPQDQPTQGGDGEG